MQANIIANACRIPTSLQLNYLACPPLSLLFSPFLLPQPTTLPIRPKRKIPEPLILQIHMTIKPLPLKPAILFHVVEIKQPHLPRALDVFFVCVESC